MTVTRGKIRPANYYFSGSSPACVAEVSTALRVQPVENDTRDSGPRKS